SPEQGSTTRPTPDCQGPTPYLTSVQHPPHRGSDTLQLNDRSVIPSTSEAGPTADAMTSGGGEAGGEGAWPPSAQNDSPAVTVGRRASPCLPPASRCPARPSQARARAEATSARSCTCTPLLRGAQDRAMLCYRDTPRSRHAVPRCSANASAYASASSTRSGSSSANWPTLSSRCPASVSSSSTAQRPPPSRTRVSGSSRASTSTVWLSVEPASPITVSGSTLPTVSRCPAAIKHPHLPG